MKEVLRLNEISPLVNSVFQDKYIMTKDAKEPVGILVRSFNMHEYKLAPSVLCVGRAARAQTTSLSTVTPRRE